MEGCTRRSQCSTGNQRGPSGTPPLVDLSSYWIIYLPAGAVVWILSSSVVWVHIEILSTYQKSRVHPFYSIQPSRGSLRSPEEPATDDQDDAARLEAERKLEELKRRRDDAESEEFERMRQRQQEAEVELEELKRKREERRKVLEEEERQKKQEEADRKAKEEV